MQNSEIECKMVKLKMNDSSDKIELGQTKWRTKMRRRLKAKYNAQQKLPN